MIPTNIPSLQTPGRDLEIGIGTGTGTISQYTNKTPATLPGMPHKKVEMITKEIISNGFNYISQGYTVIYNFATISIDIPGNVSTFIMKFGNTNFGVKFSLPIGSTHIYVTYVVKNSLYVGGWKDYESATSVSNEWKSAARNYFNGSSVIGFGTQYRSYYATFKGVNTSANEEIGSIKFKFSYSNGGGEVIDGIDTNDTNATNIIIDNTSGVNGFNAFNLKK